MQNKKTIPYIPFFVLGKEASYSLSEINTLYKVVKYAKDSQANTIFWSEKLFVGCIQEVIIQQQVDNTEKDPKSIEFLYSAFTILQKLIKRKYHNVLAYKTSKEIETGISIMLNFADGRVYTSRIIENLSRYIAITLPDKFPEKTPSELLNLQFVRPADGLYQFGGKIIDIFKEKKLIHISHAKCTREQRRTFTRFPLNYNARLALIKIHPSTYEPQLTKAIRCKLINISENGAYIVASGRGKVGIQMQLQINQPKTVISMSATVVHCTYKEDKNTSYLNLKAENLSIEIKNQILSLAHGISI